jgi:transcriptional regulator with XRE-family HTH domain
MSRDDPPTSENEPSGDSEGRDDLDVFDIKPLGLEIARLRNSRGWSLTDLSSHSGIPKNTLWRYENTINIPSVPALMRISRGLGYPVSLLLTVLDPQTLEYTRAVKTKG